MARPGRWRLLAMPPQPTMPSRILSGINLLAFTEAEDLAAVIEALGVVAELLLLELLGELALRGSALGTPDHLDGSSGAFLRQRDEAREVPGEGVGEHAPHLGVGVEVIHRAGWAGGDLLERQGDSGGVLLEDGDLGGKVGVAGAHLDPL